MDKPRIFLDLTLSVMKKDQDAAGVLRVERELAKALMRSGDRVGFFAYSIAGRSFHAIDVRAAALIVGHNDPLLDRPQECCVSGTSLVFQPGDIVVAAGYLWDWNYINDIKISRKDFGIKFICIVYDIIPLLFPEFAYPGLKAPYERYIEGLSENADVIYSISDATSHDLTRYLMARDKRVPALRRVALGTDIMDSTPDYVSPLSEQLAPDGYVLCVCTIEPRKNHVLLFNVWRSLYESDRDVLRPLVIVGKVGFNSNDLINMIGLCDRLYPDYIKICTNVPDKDLAWLYSNCLFSVYPSYYEGWGLPISESLSYGKVCLASSTSSMPEAAQGLSELLDPMDQSAWVRKVREYLSDASLLKTHEERIKSTYKAVEWQESMHEFVNSIVEK